jgi:hypothetical protein
MDWWVFKIGRFTLFQYSVDGYWQDWEKIFIRWHFKDDRYFRHLKIGRMQVNW